ncbi:MAG: nitrate transporter substrate-binding protein, partial [Polaromonas sp.]|nr:nitrate transporter substrate-binding protein [Polaromonas sp.]
MTRLLPLLSRRRAALAVLGIALPLACAWAQAAPPVVRIGVATPGGGDPVTWAGSPGGVVRVNQWLEQEFKASGVQVEWLFFKGAGPAVNEALSNRQIDFAYQGDLPSVIGRANGLKTKLLLVSGARNNLYVVTPVQSDIRGIKDLKDRKVAIFRGTNGHLVAVNLLAASGLAERDLKAVNLDVGSAQAALVTNGVDAAFGGYEWFKVRDQGLAKVVYSTQGQDPTFTRQASLLVREDFEKEHPAEVQRVVDVFVRAADWASDEKNRAELFRLWARSGTPLASLEAEFDKQ